jgi:chemosensory pili system protein ChpC
MQKIQSTIRCLLIPSGGRQLLLPSTIVAEVFGYNEPELIFNEQPKWLLGMINWREQRVPLLSIEEALSLHQNEAHSPKRYHTVVLYGLESTQTMPFYCFRATNVPSSLVVIEKTLAHFNVEKRKGLVFNIEHGSNQFLLPDVNYLENLLIKSHIFSYLT